MKIGFLALISILLCLILIPAGFANDNEQVIGEDINSTDYYFDINAADDGNGIKETPYRNFTDDRINDNSEIHLAGGEYVFEKSREFSNISFHGLNPQDTILNGNGTNLTVNGSVCFYNITLTNFNFINNGNLSAYNAVLTDMIPSNVSNHYYGGAVYAPSNINIHLENCIISDNHAQYGGALYVNGGSLEIINSLFYNNIAYSYGGAIAGESVRIKITNSRFVNAKSLSDAGGAIYLFSSSTLNAINMTVSNSTATFGSAVTALRSSLDIINSTFEDNLAKYEGGAIYQFYGSIAIESSKFINNTARNGGAVFIDDVTVLNVTENYFINNSASGFAGGIYYLLNNNINLTTNIFINNSASYSDDIYNTSSVSLELGNGNYTIYAFDNLTYNSTLPKKYDLRDYGYVTLIKDQMDGGNCWAFASLAALESCILKATGEVLDLSEENMKNLMAVFSDYGRNNRYPNNGGDNAMPIAYLVSWLGPVNDNDDAYDDKSHISPVLDSVLHVQNVLYLKRNNFTDNDAIKHAIINYGAVATTMYYSSSLVWDYKNIYHKYYNGTDDTNHAVTIIGWDDSYYIQDAPGRGAWIVRNSWGPTWRSGYNNDGCFYVSYYDAAFARPGNYASYTFILNDTTHYDKNYQYDISGPTDYFYNTVSSVWYENAFYAGDDEFLAAVSTYFEKDTDWELNIYVNSTLQLVQRGSSVPGYFTIKLDYPIPLVKGDLFEVMFKITVDGDAGFPISEALSLTKYTYSPKVSFVSYDNGNTWYDLYDMVHFYPHITYFNHHYNSQVACIKGFTQLITLNSTVGSLNITYDKFDLYNITAKVLDENNNSAGNGIVTFTVNGANYTAKVYRGIASVLVPLVVGVNNISADYASPNYYSSNLNATYDVSPVVLDVNIDVIQLLNNASIIFTLSQLANQTLLININGNESAIRCENGVYMMNMTYLEYGNYDISAVIKSDFYAGENSTAFFVNVKRTHLELDNMTTIYNSGEFLTVRLKDQFNQPAVNRTVKFNLNDNVYYNVTDDEGIAVLAINLADSIYPIVAIFEGDESYLESRNSSIITVKSSVTLPENTVYALNSNYEVYLINMSAEPLNNTLITFTINNVMYYATTDANGKAVLAISLSSGNVVINVINPLNGEVKSQNISIIPRITENVNFAAYYGANKYFKVRVFGDYGQVAGAGESVTFRMNGNSYNVYTDNNGYASLKISLKPGTYTITSTYKGFVVSNKITVKTTLITKNLKVKKARIIKFTAKLLNKDGKVLKNKKITFKIKGKTYRVKTNRNGIAKVKIRNLKTGKFTITTKYAKLQNRNRITVKK